MTATLELKHYRALRELIEFHEGADLRDYPDAEKVLAHAQEALAALRQAHPEFERFERSLDGRTPEGGAS